MSSDEIVSEDEFRKLEIFFHWLHRGYLDPATLGMAIGKRFLVFAWDIKIGSREERYYYFARAHSNIVGRFLSLDAIMEWRDRKNWPDRFIFDILNMDTGNWYQMYSEGKITEIDDLYEDLEEK